jgi:hypothetical protein
MTVENVIRIKRRRNRDTPGRVEIGGKTRHIYTAFIREIQKFLKFTGMSPTEFGRKFCNDPSFVTDLFGQGSLKRREPRLSTVDRIRAAMRKELSRREREMMS